jgi:hypothetical protein
MTDQHRASPADWLLHLASLDDADSSCILELRSRVEALEAMHTDKLDRLIAMDADPDPDAAMTELRAASAEARPAGLVERVAEGIAAADDEGLTNMTWNYHARAAIREVAAWLREGGDYSADAWADLLEREADHG